MFSTNTAMKFPHSIDLQRMLAINVQEEEIDMTLELPFWTTATCHRTLNKGNVELVQFDVLTDMSTLIA